MKMGFLLKNNARRGMGEEGVLKKGEEKEYSKRERKGVLKKGVEKKAEKGLQNSRILKRMAGWAEIRKF